jgi:hypothetical protein
MPQAIFSLAEFDPSAVLAACDLDLDCALKANIPSPLTPIVVIIN